MTNNVVMVVDMQNGVLATPRIDPEGTIGRINQIIHRADRVIFIQHSEGDMVPGTAAFELDPRLYRPQDARYITKTAGDAFYHTVLEDLLSAEAIRQFVVCGCATDYCLDTTVKVGASKGYAITVASDAHTTADRHAVSGRALIAHHNEVWAHLSVPGNPILVKTTATILADW